ncbi:MAG: ABC transporter ATP-binding protein, partial [Spirochaetaceae bacterium]
DLDADTLELLEDLLLDYNGTILLVSHDREFLDNVVTDCLVLSDGGRVQEYVGGYKDYRAEASKRQSPNPAAAQAGAGNGGNSNGGASAAERRRSAKAKSSGPRKLSYRELEALEQLPNTIAELEEEQAAIHTQLADPELYRGNQNGVSPASLAARLEDIEGELSSCYARWEELERLAAEAPG